MDAAAYRPTAPVAVCTTRAEAELKRHALQAGGIPTVLATDDAGGLHPEIGYLYCGAYRLLVPADQLDEARELLVDLDDTPPALTLPPDDALQGTEDRGLAAAGGWVAAVLVLVVVALVLAQILGS